VTPSLVTVGAPHFLSSTTLRPRGPSVTFTTSASLLTPRSSERRASSSNSRILGIYSSSFRRSQYSDLAVGKRHAHGLDPTWGWIEPAGQLLLDDGEDIAGGEHQVLLARVLDLRAAVLAVQHHVADLDIHRHALGPRVVEATRAHRQDLALLGLLLGGVRDHQA